MVVAGAAPAGVSAREVCTMGAGVGGNLGGARGAVPVAAVGSLVCKEADNNAFGAPSKLHGIDGDGNSES